MPSNWVSYARHGWCSRKSQRSQTWEPFKLIAVSLLHCLRCVAQWRTLWQFLRICGFMENRQNSNNSRRSWKFVKISETIFTIFLTNIHCYGPFMCNELGPSFVSKMYPAGWFMRQRSCLNEAKICFTSMKISLLNLKFYKMNLQLMDFQRLIEFRAIYTYINASYICGVSC